MLQRIIGTGAALGLLTAVAAFAQSPLNPGTTIVNRSNMSITEAYIAAAGTPHWGENRLGATPVQAGASRQIRYETDRTCYFNVRAVYADGRSEERRDVNICGRESAVFGEGGSQNR